jgi:hypothetical protein
MGGGRGPGLASPSMGDGATAGIVVAAVALVMAALVWLARRVRRRGTAGQAFGAAMAAYDEAMHVTAHEAYVEVQTQDERGADAQSPADG